MDSQSDDTLSFYLPIIRSINNFRGPDAYVLDIIAKVSSLPAKKPLEINLTNLSDVIRLLTLLRTNTI